MAAYSAGTSNNNAAPLLRVQSLHALLYCERLFYLEEVENVRLADAAVYAGRRLHVELAREEEGDWHALDLKSEKLGLIGRVDCLRRRNGSLIPYEHKRGRAARIRTTNPPKGSKNSDEACAWPSDRLQVGAYAMLVEEATGQTIVEGRVRYHQDNVTVRVPIDPALRADVIQSISRARSLADCVERPPVTENERLCVKCSLAPACLPEEARAISRLSSESIHKPLQRSVGLKTQQIDQPSADQKAGTGKESSLATSHVPRLFPADDHRQALHVVTPGARVGRAGDEIEIFAPEQPKERHPVREIGQVVLHGFAQITTQALRLCADKEVAVHWITQGGGYIGSFSSGAGAVQKRIRQYEALRTPEFRLQLVRRLAEAKILSQLRFVLRASRNTDRETIGISQTIDGIRKLMPALQRANSVDAIRGLEGRAGALYFKALPTFIDSAIDERMKPEGRTRRPPRDRFNALIGFAYALLLKDVMSAILTVGLDPAFGFYHRPRSQAHPLALDLIELFRVAMVDLPIVASLNRRQWDPDDDFVVAGFQVWLSDLGRRKMIELYEKRKTDRWKHPVLRYSLTYARLIELEARLLEKEWTGEPGLFARMRLR
ncbi:type I-MYXAN CRISPR-associated endonuclease Cas1 [bacterium]|nr:type I-MYXAN CRISPR-associated endonuclease Cas1 [bacterium]MCI0604158.1 type I-MYXAN CRISPR-associated endonuclease Cas1 [bacterium]